VTTACRDRGLTTLSRMCLHLSCEQGYRIPKTDVIYLRHLFPLDEMKEVIAICIELQ